MRPLRLVLAATIQTLARDHKEPVHLPQVCHPDAVQVRIGSYPAIDDDAPYKVLLRLEGRDETAVAAAAVHIAKEIHVFDL